MRGNIKILLFLLLLPYHLILAQTNTLTFTEIMFSPQSGNNEFIEIFNLSETESIDLNGYKIVYSTSNADVITSAGFGTLLIPNSYAVILEGDYDFADGIYKNLIPQNALILKISDNAFGSAGMANTSDRQLWLLSPTSDTLESYTYSANNSPAISDEKIEIKKDNSNTNWGNSLNTNGTPGRTNSITPLHFDLSFSSLTVSPRIPISGSDLQITGIIKNRGKNRVQSYSVEIYNDVNFDSIGSSEELIFIQQLNNLSTNDSAIVNAQINSAVEGNYQLLGEVIFPEDENTLNNSKVIKFTVYPPGNEFNEIVINEIMYAPLSGEPEWIELYNKTGGSVNLKKWTLSDNSTTVLITNTDRFIQSESFIVLSRDSSILNFYSVPVDIIVFNLPALNNTGDAVVIKDSLGILIDSVNYLSGWGGNSNGRSLERISVGAQTNLQSNWKTCLSINRATPGYINSVTEKDFDLELSGIIYSPSLPVFGDEVSISVKVKNTGRNIAQFSIQFYEDTDLDSVPDHLLTELTSLSIIPGDSVIHPMGYTIHNLQETKGFYTLINFPSDEDTSNNYLYSTIKPGYAFSTIIINEIMFSPSGGEPEWIEIFNRSADSINLKDWTISDVLTTPASAKVINDVYINPLSYLLIAKDSSIQYYHRLIPSEIIIISLPSFNNDKDGVVLKDERGGVIDSVLYSREWGGINGFSLERKNVDAASNLSTNWGSSTDIEQSTPGRINSITLKEYDLAVADILFYPRFPVAGENVFISAKIKNNGSLSANNFSVEFYFDSDSNNVVDHLLERISGLNLQPADSLTIQTTNTLQHLQNKVLTAVRIVFKNDEDTLNNYAERSIQPGVAPNTVLINEVMYSPINEPEWFEIVNIGIDSVNLKNWSVSDILSTPTKSFLAPEDIYIQPGEFVVVSKDTSIYHSHPDLDSKVLTANFGALSNTSDGIIIYDFRDGIIDSLLYNSKWGGKNGYSLERISLNKITNDSTNWVTSLSDKRSTPGKVNSTSSIPDYDRNRVVINEIMFDPDIDNSEFIELINISDEEVNIGGWCFHDEKGNINRLCDTSFIIQPNDYFILAADSLTINKYNLQQFSNKSIAGISSLGIVNTGELILLKDIKQNIIDSVWFSDKWHNKNILITKNRSLERINPSMNGNDQFNWSTSVSPEGATPGKQNSVYTDNLNRNAGISVSPNPFSPDNDGFEDFTLINYNITQPLAQVRIKIFDSKGRQVRTLINNKASASTGSIIFDGLDDEGRALRIGIYIIFMEALNDISGVVETLKTTIVVARKLN